MEFFVLQPACTGLSARSPRDGHLHSGIDRTLARLVESVAPYQTSRRIKRAPNMAEISSECHGCQVGYMYDKSQTSSGLCRGAGGGCSDCCNIYPFISSSPYQVHWHIQGAQNSVRSGVMLTGVLSKAALAECDFKGGERRFSRGQPPYSDSDSSSSFTIFWSRSYALLVWPETRHRRHVHGPGVPSGFVVGFP